MKKCSKCLEEKSLDSFDLKCGRPQARCKECRAIYMKKHYQDNREREMKKRKAWYEKNKSKVLEAHKAKYAKDFKEINFNRKLRKYGITAEQHERTMIEQNHSCAICSQPISNQDLDIDHCHVSGEFRGFLCQNHNTALGLFKDSVIDLAKAIQYLNKYKK